MSCGKTTTRRQAHGKVRSKVAKHHARKIGGHPIGSPAPKKHKRIVITRHAGHKHSIPKPKQKVSRNPRKMSKREQAALKAWERRHPFKDDFAQWKKRHPFKDDFAAWKKAHPFRHDSFHRVHCHIKTRHSVTTSTRRIPGVAPGPFGPGKAPQTITVKSRRAVKSAKPAKARKAVRAR